MGSRPITSVSELERRARYLTMPEAADMLRYTGPNAANSAYRFLKRHGVQLKKRGNVTLVRVGQIDDLLDTGASDFVDRAVAMAGRSGAR